MQAPIDRQRLDVDIVCVGFGPATGFQTTLPIVSTRRGVDTRTGST